MVISRVCTACVRSARLLVRPAAPSPAVRSAPFSAFAPSAPVFKKAGKSAQAIEEDEFVEDEFEDDVDSVAEQLSEAPRRGLAGQDRRAAIYEQALSDALKAVAKPKHELKRRPAPEAILASLVHSAGPQDLPRVTEVLQHWRQKDLPAPKEATIQHLLKRFSESERPQDGVALLAQRDKYRMDVPANLKATYPLFHALSRSAAAPSIAAAAVAEDGAEPSAEAEATTTPSSPATPPPSDSAFVLYNLLELYNPGAVSSDSFILLTTLASALRNGESSTARVQTLLSQLQALGEEQIVQQVQRDLAKKWQATMRMRARAIAFAMRDLDHAEFEWFAHLAETLQKVTTKA
ncbi:hypothetical protein JCM10908_001818 [Rhodotorula pacifica]|uniref:uncharacterized protein n=1 Tax=Rhodotorula pacifica TaxID=1495444 RepID=UPI00317BA304